MHRNSMQADDIDCHTCSGSECCAPLLQIQQQMHSLHVLMHKAPQTCHVGSSYMQQAGGGGGGISPCLTGATGWHICTKTSAIGPPARSAKGKPDLLMKQTHHTKIKKLHIAHTNTQRHKHKKLCTLKATFSLWPAHSRRQELPMASLNQIVRQRIIRNPTVVKQKRIMYTHTHTHKHTCSTQTHTLTKHIHNAQSTKNNTIKSCHQNNPT